LIVYNEGKIKGYLNLANTSFRVFYLSLVLAFSILAMPLL
jgi:hypothetical protein